MSLLADPATVPRSRLFFAKLQPPRPPGRPVPRVHLIEPLLAAVPAGLVLVTAPAGFGKTTLLCQIHDWMKSAGMPTGWVSLEAADSELSRFTAYLRAAFQRMSGHAANTAHEDTVSAPRADSPLADAMELTESIAASEEPFALFLDDLHEIHNADVVALLARILSVLRPEQRIVVGTRELPALDMHRLRAYGRAVELDARKMRFSLDDTRRFLANARLESLSDADVSFLHERTEGWAAAVQLAALALAGSRERPQALLNATLSAAEIADYLTEEVFARQPDEIKGFLLETSVLPNFSAELCNALTGRTDCREMIRRIENANLFLVPLDSSRQWYRFHQLFAEFLRDRLNREAGSRVKELHRKAARWLADDGRPGRAVDHALLAGDTELAARAMNQCAVDFLHSGRSATLAHWAAIIPLDTIARHPELHSACTIALMTLHRYEDAGRLIAQFLTPADGTDARRMASPLALQAFLTTWSDRLDELDARVREALRHEADLDAYRVGTLRNCEAFVRILNDDLVSAQRMFVASKEMLQKIGSRASWVYADAGVAMCDLLQGRVGIAIAYLERALEAWEPYGERFNTSNTMIAALLADAKFATRTVTTSRELLDIFLPLIKEGGFTEVLISSLRLRARIALIDGEPDQAGKFLDELESLGEQRNLPRVVASAWLEKSRMALLAGNSGAARRHLEVAAADPCWTKPEFANTYANDCETPVIGLLRCQIVSGDAGAAIAQLQGLLAGAARTRRVMRALKLRILLAQALWVGNLPAEGVAVMRQALCDAAPERLLQAFADEPWVLSPILREIARAPDAVPAAFLNELCAACPAEGAAPATHQPPAQPTANILSRREIEVLEMVAGGLSNKEMARRLFRSEATVATHLRNIYAKLEASGRMQAILKAREQGLLSR